MMNKALGYVCSSCSDSHKTVYELLPEELQDLVTKPKRGERLHTVGRLDAQTSGLLLITNDGNFSHLLTSPESHISKKYYVELEKPVDEKLQAHYKDKLKQGILLPAEKKAEACYTNNGILDFISPTQCFITISQGKFHQVRRTFLAFENLVIKLKRVEIGPLKLDENLKEGEFRYLNESEINFFFTYKNS